MATSQGYNVPFVSPGRKCVLPNVISIALPSAAKACRFRFSCAAVPVCRSLPYARCQRSMLIVTNGAKSSLPNHQTWLAQGHADAPDSAFHELGLTAAERNAGGAIGRRKYSFLMSSSGQQRMTSADWSEIFEDPNKPLVVDLGCGAGRYLLLMAHRKGPGRNYLGVDVHKALLDRANRWAAARSLSGHVHYLQANAAVSAGPLLGSYPGALELVSIQYPDPQERRQRHMVGRELVEALAKVLQPGARVYLASDFEDTATYMRNAFERFGSDSFRPDDVHDTRPVFPCTPLNATLVANAKYHRLQRMSHESRSVIVEGAQLTSENSASTVASLQPPASPDTKAKASGGVREGSDLWTGGHVWGDAMNEDDLLWFKGAWQQAGWLEENPVGAPSEREVYVEKATKGQVYRALLFRC